jgi:hypothetical protein
MSDTNSTTPIFKLSDKTYNFLKFLALVGLPTVASAYFTLAGQLNLANPEGVVGILTVITTVLGVMLGVSTKQFNKSGAAFDGAISITEGADGAKLYSLDLYGDPSTLDGKQIVSFKVGSSTTQV